MADHATPNLPSRDFAKTVAFYGQLGFSVSWQSQAWLILEQGGLCLEFFPYADLDPATNYCSCCLRLDNLDAFIDLCREAGIPDVRSGWPRLHPPRAEASGLTIAYLIDPDGTLLRLVQNDDQD